MSHLDRSSRLFSSGPWLPLRESSGEFQSWKNMGEDVCFATQNRLNLRGTLFLQESDGPRRGTILYLHELNGNRWSVGPFLETLRGGGFDVLTFDQRGHGESDTFEKFHQTPWITPMDLEDVRSAVDFICSREARQTENAAQTDAVRTRRDDSPGSPIGVFGLGKGATLALCGASFDDRIRAVVMDSPAPEDRLYEKNCYYSFMKSGSVLVSRRFGMFVTLLFKSLFFLAACPFFSFFSAWRRFMMSLWYGGRFVNTWQIVKKIRKPILILHGDVTSCVSLAQIHAFSHRMKVRPKIWLTRKTSAGDASNDEAIAKQLAHFFRETLKRTSEESTLKAESGETVSPDQSSPEQNRCHGDREGFGNRFYRTALRAASRKSRHFSFVPRRT